MIIGQYRIIEKIGQGGMGVIYKAEHTTLEQIVAVKALPSALGSSADIRERFIREAKIQAKLSHPNVVNILNFLEHEGSNYIVMEYVEGETLESIIKKTGLIPPDRCIAIFKQVLNGIEYAHSKGVIHRDIKPSNIMITGQDVVKITDFGIAKIAGDFSHTQTGVKVGTLWYMSPEQIQGQQAGVTSDIYALGITLFEMVTGKVPFGGDSEYHIMQNIVQSPPPAPREFYPYIPVSLERVILKAIAKSPGDRFQSVREFAEALVREDTGAADAVSLSGAVDNTGPGAGKRGGKKLPWALAGGLCAAISALAAVFFLHGNRAADGVKATTPASAVAPAEKKAVPVPVQVTGKTATETARGVPPSLPKQPAYQADMENIGADKKVGHRKTARHPKKEYTTRGVENGVRVRSSGGDRMPETEHLMRQSGRLLREAGERQRNRKVPSGSFTEGFTP